MIRHLLWSISLFAVTACTTHISPDMSVSDQKKLYRMLTKSGIDAKEARVLSAEAITQSIKLADKYGVTTPPLFHNFLVNIRAKQRGLCYQWSDDLYSHLKRFRFRTVSIRPVGANIGSYWTEHNALVALPAGSRSLDKGVLLDPWRRSGRLYFVPIAQDPEYRWVIRTDRGEVYQNGR